MSQIGEFSFILAGLALSLKMMPREARDLVLAAALISIVINPLVFAALRRWQRRPRGQAAPDERADPAGAGAGAAAHGIVMVGYGRVGSQLAALLRARGMHWSVIDDDADLVHKAHADGIAAIRGNAASAERLAELHAGRGRTPRCWRSRGASRPARSSAACARPIPAMVILARAHNEAEVRHLLEQRRRRRGACRARTGLFDGGDGVRERSA